MITILIGKSGSGKDYNKNKLINKGYEPIITYTTRPMRVGEKNGVDYWFVNDNEFMFMVNNNEFIEYREYNTEFGKWYYGTRKDYNIYNNNKEYVIILDVKGAIEFIKYYGRDNVRVVLLECSDEIRESRVMNRKGDGVSWEEWERRKETDNVDFSDDKINEIVDYRIVNENKSIEEVIKEIVDKM